MVDLNEKLYTVKEVAYILRCSYDTARRDFLNEEGVLERGNSGPKRVYRQLLIPESVLLRVIRRREKRSVSFRSAA